jgi:hypothetical protein
VDNHLLNKDSSSEAHLKSSKKSKISYYRSRIINFCQNILILSRDRRPLMGVVFFLHALQSFALLTLFCL